jgi:hypothetical protein
VAKDRLLDFGESAHLAQQLLGTGLGADDEHI